MDPLSNVLESLKLAGSLYCRTELAAPWGIDLPPAAYAHFHVVERGSCWLRLYNHDAPVSLVGGDLVVVPHGNGHTLTDQPDSPPFGLRELIAEATPGRYPLVRHGGDGVVTRLICGSFRLERAETHPLLTILPPLLVIRGTEGRAAPWLEPVLRFLADEARDGQPGAASVITRLVDVLFVQAVRAWLTAQPEGTGGWLGALRDQRISEALGLIHRQPEHAWTVASLAAAVAMSRSAFAARFTRLVGEAPLTYLTRWRMHQASAWLEEADLSVATVAERLGYESEAAFSKAFKRTIGAPPSAYRRRAHVA